MWVCACVVWQSTKSNSHQGWKEHLVCDILRWLLFELCWFLHCLCSMHLGMKWTIKLNILCLVKSFTWLSGWSQIHILCLQPKKCTTVDYTSTMGQGDRSTLELNMNNSELRHNFWLSALCVRIIGRCFGVPVCERSMHKRCAPKYKCVTHQLSQGPWVHAGHVKYSTTIIFWQWYWNIEAFLLA